MPIARFRAALAWAAASLAACSVQPRVPPPSTDIDETVFREHVRVLASDDFQGRKPGTGGEEKTVGYLTEQFKRLGLKPVNGESYLQAVPMTEIAPAAHAALTLSGHGPALALENGGEVVFWSKRTQPQIKLSHSGLVFVGYGVVAPEFSWNDYAGTDVQGKTVVVLAGDPGYGGHDPKLFKGGAMSYYGRWAYKIEEASRHGAEGVLLIHDAASLGIGWEAVRNTWSGAQLELSAEVSDAAHPALEGWLRMDTAKRLFGAAGVDFAASVQAAGAAGFKAIPLPLQADAVLNDTVRQFNSSNVAALLPGGSRKKEYVIYAAHWDHLGRDPQLSGHGIYNGASDNASGVAGLLTLAQSFVRTRPAADRSIVFLALTGGDSGLLGSRFYVDNPLLPLRDAAAVFNLDVLHRGGPTRDVTVFGAGNSDLDEPARAVALLQGREVSADPFPGEGVFDLSDSFSFAQAGVPVLYARGGLDDAARGPTWGRTQLQDYAAHRFHQSADQYSPDWDVRGAIEDLTLYYEVGNRVARSRRFPRWYPSSDYRVSRERRAAQ